ncbi:MAG: cell division protein FtsL [Acidobacteriota bacterium]|nr:cell division protein FtsL [Acidobacteriota bacterium]
MVRKKMNAKLIVLGVGSICLLLVILTFYIWYQTEAIRLGLESGKLENKIQSLKEEIKQLEVRKAALLSLDRVEKTAREQLGFSEPRPDQVVYEDNDFQAARQP